MNLDEHFSFGENDKSRRSDGTFDFANFMKCIEDLSYSAMFSSEENSKKFVFKPLAKKIAENNNPELMSNKPPRFSGQSTTNQAVREKTYLSFAKSSILERKNELGLILDLVSSCLDVDPKKRPTIQGLLNSPIFQLDNNEMTNAVRFS